MLSDRTCKSLKPQGRQYKRSDGEGLYLLVRPNGSKLWQMAYRYDGKQKTLSFGVYPDVGLKDARALRSSAKDALAKGIDPQASKAKASSNVPAPLLEGVGPTSFKAVTLEWLRGRRGTVTDRHLGMVERRFERLVFPSIGAADISQVGIAEVLPVLKRVEDENGGYLAGTIRQYLGQVFRYARANQLVHENPIPDLKDALKPLPPVQHNPILKAPQIPEFIRRLRGYDGDELTRYLLEFIMHTFVRTGELRFAKREGEWETDRVVPLWRIPAERMKKPREHLVPLSPQALALYQKIYALSEGSEFLCPGRRRGVMSENTLLYALYRMGYRGQLTVHGLRGTASTVLNESCLFDSDWIERQLAHDDDDRVRAAYNAAQYLDKRYEMMCWWSDYIDQAADA